MHTLADARPGVDWLTPGVRGLSRPPGSPEADLSLKSNSEMDAVEDRVEADEQSIVWMELNTGQPLLGVSSKHKARHKLGGF